MDETENRSQIDAPEAEGTESAEAEAARLRDENEALRSRLEAVIETASENEMIWRHFAAIERILFRTRELETLVEELLHEIRTRFQTDLLVFFVSHPELRERLLADENAASIRVEENTWLSPVQNGIGPLIRSCASRPLVFTGGPEERPPDEADCSADPSLFDSPLARSGVLAPVAMNEVLFGALLLGSSDSERYSPEDGTDLLEQLGANIALSMENCLTYEKVRQFSVHDPLTGLLNFFQIHTVLETEFRKAHRAGNPLSVLVIDLDFVEGIKEEFEGGGEVLSHVANLLREILPKKDCILGRYGSAEFMAVLPGVPEEEAREVAPYLAGAVRKAPFRFGNTAVLISTTMGIGALSDKTGRAQDLVDAACAEICRHKLAQSA